MRSKFLIFGLSLCCYGMALALPCLLFQIVARPGETANAPTGALNAYGLPDNVTTMSGLELTIAGFVGLLLMQGPAIGWLANPLYWLACLFWLEQQSTATATTAALAIGLGLAGTASAFWLRLPNGTSPYTELVLAQLLTGFWLWLAAPGLLAVGAGWQLWQLRSTP